MKYDPTINPDTRLWLDLSEDAQIRIVREFHHSGVPELLKEELHAAFHVMIENQLALREAPVQKTMDRLIDAGLERHDAIHAIVSVLIEHLYDIVHRGSPGGDNKDMYYQDLAHLSAEDWKKSVEDSEQGPDLD